MDSELQEQPVIVFDGVCVLCSRWVTFLIKRDPNRQFRFAAMQSQSGRALLTRAGLDPEDPSSFVLAQQGRIYRETDAIIAVLRRLSGPWGMAASLISIVPRTLRDWLYFRIARNRYKLFGRRDACYAPMAEDKDRFIL